MQARSAVTGLLVTGVLAAGGCGQGSAEHVATAASATGDDSSYPDGPSGPSTTTTSTSDSTSSSSSSTTSTTLTPTSTSEPSTPTHRVVTGTHAGVEHFALDTRRCSFLDHRLEETWTLADGTAWHYVDQYCGTLTDGNHWSGTGTFTLTASDGALSGRSTSAAIIPSVGVPYHLDVDNGTGYYAGTTGTCTVDEHLRPESFGTQDHFGTFECDLTR